MATVRQPLGRLTSLHSGSLYVCRSCRGQLPRSKFDATQRRTIFDTEKIRKKIWGTDNPPGLKDPYGGPSILEKRRMRREAEAQGAANADRGETAGRPIQQAQSPSASARDVEAMESGPAVLMEEYKEATTWDGLRHVGHLGTWKDLDPIPADIYTPWLSWDSLPVESRHQLVQDLHQAVVECYACLDAKVDPTTVFQVDPDHRFEDIATQYKIVPSPNGDSATIEYASPQARESAFELLRYTADQMTVSKGHSTDELQSERVSTAELDELDPETQTRVEPAEAVEKSFLSLRVDPSNPLTFTILKRFTQISGQRVPDHVLSGVVSRKQTLSNLVDRLFEAKKRRPQTVAETLMENGSLGQQANVWVMPRRETQVDKERDLGRWKIIKQELQDRGLPLQR